MVELTILEALSELKLLKQRIHKQLSAPACFVDVWKSEEMKDQEAVCQDAKSRYQSIRALLARRMRIKAKIMLSNATTTVKIGEQIFTVAEAIAMKEMIHEDQMLLETLRQQHTQALDSLEAYNRERQRKIDALLERNFSKDSGKANSDDIRTITEMYQKKYYAEIIDPLSIAAEIEKLENRINVFQNTVNTKLAHSNATTLISIEDN